MDNTVAEEMELYNKKSILNSKSVSFAIRIVEMVKFIRKNHSEPVMTNQVLRSGTAIGALIMESEFAQSRPDFINKLGIAQKETNETNYWLLILNKTGYLEDRLYDSMRKDCNELMAIITASIRTAKNLINIKGNINH